MAPHHLFPCDVTGPDGTVWLTCQVVTSPDGVTVWAWSDEAQTGQAVVVSEARLVENAPNADQWTLDVPAHGDVEGGEAYVILRDNCGCGRPMKRWVPPGPSRVEATS